MAKKPPFTDSEKFFLVGQFEEYKKILGSRQIDNTTNRLKTQVWSLIADELTRQNPIHVRTAQEVRKKWQNLVAAARRELKDAEMKGTPLEQTPWIWRKVAELSAGSIYEEGISSAAIHTGATINGSVLPQPDSPELKAGPSASGTATAMVTEYSSRDPLSSADFQVKTEILLDDESPSVSNQGSVCTPDIDHSAFPREPSAEAFLSHSYLSKSPAALPEVPMRKRQRLIQSVDGTAVNDLPFNEEPLHLPKRPSLDQIKAPSAFANVSAIHSGGVSHVKSEWVERERWRHDRQVASRKFALEQRKLRAEAECAELTREKMQLELSVLRKKTEIELHKIKQEEPEIKVEEDKNDSTLNSKSGNQ